MNSLNNITDAKETIDEYKYYILRTNRHANRSNNLKFVVYYTCIFYNGQYNFFFKSKFKFDYYFYR